ncbi:MAG: iron ABC transporter permease [SAR324 cluster bacterium]|nr:iron ABC transporter permease [SAR324 cluster bacterium]MBL7034342.1 iron ABC transporter permease [SAR324 cluster bacterium]
MKPSFLSFGSWNLFTFLLALLFALPFLSLLLTAASGAENIWGHLLQTVMPGYLKNTLWLMLGVGSGTLLLGVSAGWLISMSEFPGRKILEWALLLPLAFPGYIIAMVYVELLEYSGPLQTQLRQWFGWLNYQDYWFPQITSLGGAVLMLSLVLYPYVYLLTRTAFLQQSATLLEASRMLGKSAGYSFLQIALPLARPAIVVGVSLAMMETLADFGTMQLFAVQTFTTGIYHTWFGSYNAPGAAQLSLSLLMFISVFIMLERYSRKKQRFHAQSSVQTAHPRYRLAGIKAFFALIFCLFPVIFGFALPAALLIQWAIESWRGVMLERFFSDAGNSLLLAAITAFLGVSLGLLMAFGSRLSKHRRVHWAVRLVSLGYALPGPVVALGVLLPFAWFDRTINNWAEATFGFSSGYLLSGTIFILVFAYLVRFLALAYGSAESGLGRITTAMEDASRSLGKNSWQTLKRIHLPLLSSSMLTAGLLVFVDVMKELPATLMLQPFNFSTLATRAYGYATEELLKEASLWCLTIVLVGLFPVILLNRQLRKSAPQNYQDI